MHEFGFEKLQVWQLSRQLVKDVYSLTVSFPNEEKFGLVSQLRRAVISISSNIAEGSTRSSFKEQAHFSSLSYGSLMEVLCQLTLSVDLNYADSGSISTLRVKIEEISNKLNSLRKSQLKRAGK
ncbi:MAG: four helix bundle protein [Lentisphaeraceae bacterium]|nr:four helix bundle protein [Lentisphaeraceae bacterium]